MWQMLNALAVGGATVAATLGAARPAPPSSVSLLDAPAHPTVAAAIAVPANAAPRAPDGPQVSAVGGGGTVEAAAAAPRPTVIVARQVRRAGDGTFAYTVPRSPVFGDFTRAGHLVAFGEFPSRVSRCSRSGAPMCDRPPPSAPRPTTPPR